MTDGAPLDRFNKLIDRFEQIQGFVDQARARADRFRPEVIQRVVEGHTNSLNELLVDVVPLMIEVEEGTRAAESERESIDAGAAASRLVLEELELRNLIGDLDDDAWQAERGPHADRVAAVETDLSRVDGQIELMRAALRRWEIIGRTAGVLQG
jgi:hypothetical protein